MTRLRSPKLNACGGGRDGIPEVATLDVFATLIDGYHYEHFPIDPSDPIEAINFRNEQQGLTRRDLEAMLGARARVAELSRFDLIQTRCSRRRPQEGRDLIPLILANVSSNRVWLGNPSRC